MQKKLRPGGALRRLLGRSLFASVGVIAAPVLPVDAATAVHERADPQPSDDADDDAADDALDDAFDDALESIADTTDVAHAARQLALRLERMNPFDATRTAAEAALSSRRAIRRAIAEALASPVRLIGDDFVLDQLAHDTDIEVRAAASRAARARRLDRSPHAIADALARPHPPRVLVIDDYTGSRDALCACLSELGCDAIGAPTEIASHDVEWRDLVDVLVANHDPPWSDGKDLVVQVRRRAPELPAILVTYPAGGRGGVGDGDGDGDRIELGDEITLARPLALEDLVQAIDTLAPKTSRLG